MSSIAANSEMTYFRYLPVSPRDRHWGLYVTTAGYVGIASQVAYPPSGHPQGYAFSWDRGRVLHEYQLHYISRGAGTFESEHCGPKRIEAGSVFLLFPGVWHRYKPRKTTGWDEYWIGFNGDGARRLTAKSFFSSRSPVISGVPERALLDLFTEVISVLRNEPVGYAQILGSLTGLALAHVHAAARSKGAGDSRVQEIMRRAKAGLCESLDRHVVLPQLARDLNVSYAWLRRMFHHHTGLSLNQYHLQMRVKKATELLAGTDLSIKEIAVTMGYEDSHYFCRIFKRKTGRSPQGWRRLYTGGRRRHSGR